MRMARIDFTMLFRNVLFVIVLILICLSILSTVFVFIQASTLDIQINYSGLTNFFNLFAPFGTIYGSMVVSLSAYVAIESLNNRKIVEEGKAILELKKLFNNPELQQVNQNFRPISGKWNNDNLPQINGLKEVWPEVDAYIEVFELANKLIDSKVISLTSFKDHFGYSFECLIENDKIRFSVRVSNRGWRNFKELCQKMNVDLKTYKPKWDLNEK